MLQPVDFARNHRKASRHIPTIAAAYTAAASRAFQTQGTVAERRLRAAAARLPPEDVPLNEGRDAPRGTPRMDRTVPHLRAGEIFLDGWDDQLRDEFGPEIERAAEGFGVALLGSAALYGAFKGSSKLLAGQVDRLGAYGSAIGDSVDAMLGAAAQAGMSFGTLLDNVGTFFDGLASWYSERIGGDEAQVTANGITTEAGVWGSVLAYKGWQDQEDDRVRDGHNAADIEQPVPMDEPFQVNGEPLMFPGDPDGSDANICNCRCELVILGADGEPLTDDNVDDEALAMEMDAAEEGGDQG